MVQKLCFTMLAGILIVSCGRAFGDTPMISFVNEWQPSDDAIVKQASPDTNFDLGQGLSGAAVDIGIQSDGSINRCYYKLDLERLAGHIVDSVSLTVWHLGMGLHARGTTANWSEKTLTWNNQPVSFSSWTADMGMNWFENTWARRSIELPPDALSEIQKAIDDGIASYTVMLFYEGDVAWPYGHAGSRLKECTLDNDPCYLPAFTIHSRVPGILKTYQCQPSDDALVKESAPNSNFNYGGGLPYCAVDLGVMSDDSINRSFFKLDLVALKGLKIESVSFSVEHLGRGLDVTDSGTNWDEETVTWNTQPVIIGTWHSSIGWINTFYGDWGIRTAVFPQIAINQIQNAINNGNTSYGIYVGYEGLEPWPWSHANFWFKETDTPENKSKPTFTITAIPSIPSTCQQAVSFGYSLSNSDLNGDCYVNLKDIALMAGNWLISGNGLTGDINKDGSVNLADVARMADNWLRCVDPINNICEKPWFE